jgi:hypothetical protein
MAAPVLQWKLEWRVENVDAILGVYRKVKNGDALV